ncbi:unnamed protein product [Symbiodinium sp. CCMP2592]|nr:unnamed protein product [Symbiodinium sp. CCMP2592]
MAIAWGSKDFAKELSDVQKLLNFSPNPQLQASLLNVLQKKVVTADSLPAREYVNMLQSVEQSGLDENTKKALSDALLKNASGGSTEGGCKLVKVPQTLKNPVAYLTKEEIVQIMQGDIKDAPILIARRLRVIGLTSRKECTKKSCVTLHVQAHLWQNLQQPDADKIYKLATDFQDVFHSLNVQSDVPAFRTYPDDPRELGPDWIAKACIGSHPSCAELPQLHVLSKSCPIRTTSRLLKGTSQGSNQLACNMSMHAMQQKTWLETMKEKLAEEEARQAALKQTRSSCCRHLQIPLLHVPAQSPADAPENKCPQKQSVPGANEGKSLEQYEAEALAQVENKKAPKQEKKNGKPCNQKMPQLFKKPAAKCVEKHPMNKEKKAAKQDGRLTCWGCARCRGNVYGCDNCNFDGFAGVRLNGRAEWKKHMEERKKAAKH